jgi:hypothetical protein
LGNPSFLEGKKLELWCDDCDRAKVKSDDPETGTFFSREGHEWDFYDDRLDDAYTTIVWAVCKECLNQ